MDGFHHGGETLLACQIKIPRFSRLGWNHVGSCHTICDLVPLDPSMRNWDGYGNDNTKNKNKDAVTLRDPFQSYKLSYKCMQLRIKYDY